MKITNAASIDATATIETVHVGNSGTEGEGDKVGLIDRLGTSEGAGVWVGLGLDVVDVGRFTAKD